MYAIVEIAGQQFKVEKDQEIFVHRLGEDSGSSVEFDQVLLLENGGKVTVGTPTVDGAMIRAKILEHMKGDKVLVFHKKRRKGYQKENGHRQYMSKILIEDILTGVKKKEKKETPKKEEPKAKKDEPVKEAKAKTEKPAAKVEQEKKAVKEEKPKAAPKEEKAETKPAAKASPKKEEVKEKTEEKKPATKAKKETSEKKDKPAEKKTEPKKDKEEEGKQEEK
jgi:large subunit ribosomal protein L21